MRRVQATDIAPAEDLNDAEADRVLDSGDSFVHVHNIEKSGINVNTGSVYFIIQTIRVLTGDGTFAIFGDTTLSEAYAQRFSTELQVQVREGRNSPGDTV